MSFREYLIENDMLIKMRDLKKRYKDEIEKLNAAHARHDFESGKYWNAAQMKTAKEINA